MQIVIDIDEKEYKRIIEGNWIGEEMAEIFANGTVLPPKHGRLIDADAITKDLNTLTDSFIINMDNFSCGILSISCTAPTILEARKDGD